MIDAITADYQRLDPPAAAYFAAPAQRIRNASAWPTTTSSSRAIKAKYAGIPVGASESIFAPLAQASA